MSGNLLLILALARRHDRSLGAGSLLAVMLPYALSFRAVGPAMKSSCVTWALPLGAGAQVFYTPPAEILE